MQQEGAVQASVHPAPSLTRRLRRMLSWQRAAVCFELAALAGALVAVVVSLLAAASGQW
jgi:hypothetical protein